MAQKKNRGGSKDEFQEQRNRDFGPFWSDGLVMVRYKTAPDAPGPSFPPFGLLRHKLSCFWGAQMATSLVHQRIISVSSDASQALYESQPNCQWTPYADFSNLDNVAVVSLFVQKPNNKETNRLVFFSPPWLASEMVIWNILSKVHLKINLRKWHQNENFKQYWRTRKKIEPEETESFFLASFFIE